MRGRAIAWGVAVVGAFEPAVAFACPVCLAARDKATQLAFLGTTILLTSLPVIMVGGVIVWVARRSRELDTASRPQPKRKRRLEPAPPQQEADPSSAAGAQPVQRGV